MIEDKVSIIMPVYNSSSFISESIESVIAQSYVFWELIIVDDCSTDNSIQIIEQFLKKDIRIKLIKLEKNSGAAAARNIAIKNATGRYFAFLDSDDLWKSAKLKNQLLYMKKNNIAFSFSSYSIINEKSDIIKNKIFIPAKIDYKHYLKNTIIGCLTVILDSSKIDNIEFPDLKTSQDMALWLKILKKGVSAYGIQETLALYRINPSSNTANKFKAAKDVWKLYRKFEKLSILYSFYNFICYSFNAIKKKSIIFLKFYRFY